MPPTLSADLRLRVAWLYHCRQIKCDEIAGLLCIHVSTVYRINHYQTTGTVSPVSTRRGPSPILSSLEEQLILESLMDNLGIYLNELQDELLCNTGTQVRISTIVQAFRRLGYPRKRLQYVAMHRNDKLEFISYLPAHMLVWLYETDTVNAGKEGTICKNDSLCLPPNSIVIYPNSVTTLRLARFDGRFRAK